MADRSSAPPILVFDVNETLLDLTTLEPLFVRVFEDAAVLREWFAQLILYSEAMTLCGLYTPFGQIASGVLHMVGATKGVTITDADVEELKMRMGSMPAHSDAAPALLRLQDAGFRLVTLTNSASGPSPTPLERAGLSGCFEKNYSVEQVGRFKPDPGTYRLVADELGVGMSDLCLVACHLWDTMGAQAAGCLAALVTRPGNALLPAEGIPVPDLVAPTLTELVEQIIDRWTPPA